MKLALTVVQSVLSVLAGYALMVALITVVQEGIFGGVSYTGTPLPELGIAGLLTVLCAVAGGATTALLAPGKRLAHASLIAILVGIETTGFAVSGGTGSGDPIWFDVAAGASLMVGAVVGAVGAIRWSPVALGARPVTA